MPETTPGYAVALAAAEHEAREQYVHKLAAELIERSPRPAGAQSMTKVSFCKHGFPVQPPHGSLAHPGDCTGCGITWIESQQQLEAQEAAHRLATAHEDRCDHCHKTRMRFKYQREEQPWEDTSPPVIWLCTPCWGTARENEENTGFTDFNDLFDCGSDEQLERGLRGAL